MVVPAGKKSRSTESGHALELERNFHVSHGIDLRVIKGFISCLADSRGTVRVFSGGKNTVGFFFFFHSITLDLKLYSLHFFGHASIYNKVL